MTTDPLSCITMKGVYHEPDTLVVDENMPTIVKNQWPNPIVGPKDIQDYIKYINDLPTGTINESDLIGETAKAGYALYNSVISASTSINYETEISQLEGNTWKKILYGYYIEKDEIQIAENVLQSMVQNEQEDIDFVFIQEIVIDKLYHEINEVPLPFTISSIEKQRVEAIINNESNVSGYASALYFDIFGEVLLPTYSGSSGSIPRRFTENNFSDLRVYPNPSKDVLYLDGLEQSEKVEVYDLYLNKIISKEVEPNESINISNLKVGVYLLKSTNYGTVRFIKN